MPSGWPGAAPRNRRVRPGVLAVIVVVAAAAGAGITAAAVHDLSSTGAIGSGGTGPVATGPGGQPAGNGVPGGQGAIGGGLPGAGGAVPGGGGAVPGGGSGAAGALFLIGTVTAVSRTSITIGGPGHTITAAVTGATRVTGKISAVTGIKAGDQVSAQITRGSTGNVAVAIADPAQPPAGGSLP